jgi:uncharacterized protein YxjI
MGFRERRQERREERREHRDERRGDNAIHYQMRQRLVSIGDDYWVEDDEGRRVFKVDGKALRIRQTMNFDDAQGKTLLRIQERKLRVRDTMEIEDADGRTVATLKKALVSPLRERMTVSVEGGPDLRIQGNLLDHEYRIEQDGAQVAEVSKRWFRVADTYGVEIAPGQHDVLLLAVTAGIDAMTDD